MKGEGGRVGEHAAVAGKAEGPGREAKGKIERWEVKDTTDGGDEGAERGGGATGSQGWASRRIAENTQRCVAAATHSCSGHLRRLVVKKLTQGQHVPQRWARVGLHATA